MHGSEVAAGFDPLLLLPLRQKLEAYWANFFYQAQVLLKDDKSCSNWDRIGLGKVLYSHPGIFLDSGGDSSDELKVPHGFLGVQVALILRHFAGLHFVNKVVYCGFVKALVSKSKVSRFFNLAETFPGSGNAGDKIPNTCHSTVRRG